HNIPITGSIANNGGTFTGALDITRFAVQNGQLVALGNLTGTLTPTLGQPMEIPSTPVMLPVAALGPCPILHLDRGPRDLNLLGLTVHLNEAVLNITAQQAPGNLLGNLLCSVSHLLDSPSLNNRGAGAGALNGVAGLLNQILAAL